MNEENIQITPIQRNYETEKRNNLIPLQIAFNHPLETVKTVIIEPKKKSKRKSKRKSKSKKKSKEENPLEEDPLTKSEEYDPLTTNIYENKQKYNPYMTSGMLLSNTSLSITETSGQNFSLKDDFELQFVPWTVRKTSILAKYTTNSKISIQSKFKDDNDFGTDMQNKQTSLSQKVSRDNSDNLSQGKTKIERLKASEQEKEREKKLTLTQDEYLKYIQKITEELGQCWNNNDRVGALRYVIRAAKMLRNTSCLPFYPSQFFLLADLFDSFGDLVFDRLLDLTDAIDPLTGRKYPPLNRDFTIEQVPEPSKETARNWFYKIVSVREVLPRIYTEIAFLSCYKFFSNEELGDAIERLGKMIRGIGKPITALYCRAYLVKKAKELLPNKNDFIVDLFEDYLLSFKHQLLSERHTQYLQKKGLDFNKYIDLHKPAIEWIIQNIGLDGNNETFLKILSIFKENCQSSMIFEIILNSFRPSIISSNITQLIQIFQELDDSIPRYKLYVTLGRTLCITPPPKEKILKVLNEIWNVVSRFPEIHDYISVAEVFIEYPLKNCSTKHVDVMVKDILRHISKSGSKDIVLQIATITQKIIWFSPSLTAVLFSDNFTKLMNLITGDSKVELAKTIVNSLMKSSEFVSDPLILYSIFEQTKLLHDSITSLSTPEQIKEISQLISNFLEKTYFGNEVEKELNFLVECRETFLNLDSVIGCLVQRALLLTMKTFKIVKKKHTKKTTDFVKACLSYAYITIPSMNDYFLRLNLYLQAGEISLINSIVSQADTFFRAALTLFQELSTQKSSGDSNSVLIDEQKLIDFLRYFSSILLVVPGHPELGASYLIKAMIKVLKDFPWSQGSDAKIQIYFSLIMLFASLSQRNYIYHVPNIDSNDTLYAGDSEFLQELQGFSSILVQEVMNELYVLEKEMNPQSKKKNAILSLDFFNILIEHYVLDKQSAKLLLKLFENAKKSDYTDRIYLKNTLDSIQKKQDSIYQQLFSKLSKF
ncbi:esophageal cancer associated protein [Anaeramoeba ignava]|uniref:Esophageal cancer associated protein n=1 Tax=Anaeramoeba ignava TaxID=1746090 RepID=A0A9Q0LM93_ANAIG|nr:esophageal cancer associated protein [Anaeramoeba ignava]